MTEKNRPYIALVVIALIIIAIFVLEGRKAETTPTHSEDQQIAIVATNERVREKEKEYTAGYEISTPDGFLNVDDITVSELIGKKVILVDFWTYSCINCQRTLPYLNEWHDAYADDGLVILGIHTPEFDFEKDFENVARAVEKYEIEYPVVLDNDFSTWRSYENRFWPRKYLIDIDGFIVYDHIGEGAYEETEQKIVELLNERAQVLGTGDVVILKEGVATTTVEFGKVLTPEIYFGADRIEYLANLPEQKCFNASCEYVYSGNPLPNTYELEGVWKTNGESVTLESSEGGIYLYYSASSVNMVAGAEDTVSADVYLDGELHGTLDIFDEDLYNLVDLDGEYGEHMLEIRFKGPGVEAFTFTFG